MRVKRTAEGLELRLGPMPYLLLVYELEASGPRVFTPEDPEERAKLAAWLSSVEWAQEIGEALAEYGSEPSS